MPRVFQNFDVYPGYLKQIHSRIRIDEKDFIWKALLDDRFLALHMLKPILYGIDGMFSIAHDKRSQRSWAKAAGLKLTATYEEILLTQIEESRADVFYNLDPLRFGSDFLKRLPSEIKFTIAWRAAPSGKADFGAYDRIVCNFESILQSYRDMGWQTGWFYPAMDPVMKEYRKDDRSTDILFVGTYSQYHQNRAKVIEALAKLRNKFNIRLHLQLSRLSRIANSSFGNIPPFRRYRLPHSVSTCVQDPVYGRDLYAALGNTKIVINGAIDMAGSDRGNMRCWEAMGSEALLLTDAGNYPLHMKDGKTMVTYNSIQDMVDKITWFLENSEERKFIAESGAKMLQKNYNKDQQWKDFVNLL